MLLNVGTRIETSVNRLYAEMARLAGHEGLQPVRAPARAGELDRIALDPSAARDDLGWEPFTSLEDGLRAVLESVKRS